MFADRFSASQIAQIQNQSATTTTSQVQALLTKSKWDFTDIPALISPAARQYLEPIAQIANRITTQRFGKTMTLYAPLYLSNTCQNECQYCGYKSSRKYQRKTLTPEEILTEGRSLKQKGFTHILLLTGEAPKEAGIPYIENAIKILSPHFASIGLEIFPCQTDEYVRLIAAGADRLTIYQETYDPTIYNQVHLKGKKRDYAYRLNTPDRAAQAGFHQINIGALLGLANWRTEAIAIAFHVRYLTQTYWKTQYAVSVPRIQDMGTPFAATNKVTDQDLVQFIIAMRLVFPDLGITLSTREPAALRDNLLPLGITSISAESATAPGGYAGTSPQTKQFEIADPRTLIQIQAVLTQKGYDPVTKDWDRILSKSEFPPKHGYTNPTPAPNPL